MVAHFLPRQSFSVPSSVPKTYYLGHHHAGANKIRNILPSISLVLECRDFRLPLSTRNPILEKIIHGTERLIVYTKSDLGIGNTEAKKILQNIYGDQVVFWNKNRTADTVALLQRLRNAAMKSDSLTGVRALIVGMPNVGKSTLLNALRSAGTAGKKRKAAQTGDQAGVTRNLGTSVRIVDSEETGGVGSGVFVLDSPGIFQPYVDDGEKMIKLALVNCVKKGLIRDEILADYLLYKTNLRNPLAYGRYCHPTNDIIELLIAVSRREGKLKAGGVPNFQEAAARILSQWREGKLGKIVLDDLSETGLQDHEKALSEPWLSLSQARRIQKG